MKPLRLEIENFGSYLGNTVIDFEAFGSGVFQITGKTGAGKTLIFDALVYALYGSPSGSDRDAIMMRSKLLEDRSKDTMVQLTFLQNGKRYTVKRAFRNTGIRGEKGKFHEDRDKNGLSKDMILLDDKDKKIASNETDVTKKVTELLGFNREQFCQIIMLAQGEFQKFLNSGDVEKAAILQTLFDHTIYKQYEDMISQAKASLEDERKEETNSIKYEMGRFRNTEETRTFGEGAWHEGSPTLLADLEKLIRREEEKKKEAEAGKTKVSNDIEQRIHQLGEAQGRNDQLEELKKKREHLQELETQEPEMKTLKDLHERVEQAFTKVSPKISAEKGAKEDLAKNKKNISNLEDRLAESEKEKKAADDLVRKDKEEEPKRETVAKEIHTLDLSIPDYQKRDGLRKNVAERTKKLEKDRNDLQKQGQQLDELRKRLEEIKEEMQALGTAAAAVVETEADLKKKNEIYSGFTDQKKGLIQRVTSILQDEVELKKRVGEAEKDKIEADRLERVYDELNMRFLAGQAGLLARKLKKTVEAEGQGKCPVCNTLFTLGQDMCLAEAGEDIPEQTEVDKAKAAWEKQDKKREASAGAHDMLEEQLKTRRSETVDYAGRLLGEHVDWELLAGGAFLEEKKKDLEKEIRTLNAAVKQAKEDATSYKNLQDESEKKQKELTDKTGKQEALSRGIEAETNELRGWEADLAGWEGKLTYDNEDAVKAKIQELKTRKKQMDSVVDDHETEAKNASEKYDQISGQLKNEKNRTPELEEKIRTAQEELAEALRETGFASAEDAEKVLEGIPKPEDWIRKIRDELTAYDNDRKNTADQIRELSERTAGWEMQDIEALQRDIDAEKEKLDNLDQEFARWRTDIEAHSQTKKNVEGAKEKLADTEQAWKMLRRLASIAAGETSEGGKISFMRYVLGATFRDILMKANVRLEVLSKGLENGHFQLVHKVTGDRSNSQVGLGIEVLRGGVRMDTASLSGGERFVASMALALGLSDVVLSRSGGAALDTLFIDEGFGTLDNEILAAVMSVLNELTKDKNHLVGIITHVEGIEEYLGKTNKLIVTKNPDGSSSVVPKLVPAE